MKKSLSIFLLIPILAFVISCEKADEEPPVDVHPVVELSEIAETSHNGCKTSYARSIKEFVQLRTTQENQLSVHHFDVMMNCQPGKISYQYLHGAGLISIVEKEESTAANCICPYDLSYTLHIPYGKYMLDINGYVFGEFEFSPTTDVILYKLLSPQS